MPLTHAHNIGHLYLIENQGHVVTGIVLIAASTWSYQNGISACSGAGGDEVRLSRKLYPLPSGFYQTIQVVGTHTTGFMTVLYVNNTMVRVARGTGVITIAPAAVVYHLNCSGTHSLLAVVTRAVSSMPVYTTVPVTRAPSEVEVVGNRLQKRGMHEISFRHGTLSPPDASSSNGTERYASDHPASKHL